MVIRTTIRNLPIETMPNDLSPMPNTMSDPPPASARFYEDMPSFDDFAGFTDIGRYRPLPGDWQVVIADIRGSTKAIAEGRYKDVNMMGAACITAVLNALKAFDPVTVVPYVFGGDGATLAVPSFAVAEVRRRSPSGADAHARSVRGAHRRWRSRLMAVLLPPDVHPGAKRGSV